MSALAAEGAFARLNEMQMILPVVAVEALRHFLTSGENWGKPGDRRNVPQLFDEWKLVNVPSVPSFPPVFHQFSNDNQIDYQGTLHYRA